MNTESVKRGRVETQALQRQEFGLTSNRLRGKPVTIRILLTSYFEKSRLQ
ncbi:MAG: hypothetical protein WCS79_07520 [Paludibacter sp.]